MTSLLITPNTDRKTARFSGTVAAGEHVAVTINGGASWSSEGLTLRVIDLTTKRTLAVFPRPEEALGENEEPDAWGTSGANLTCTLNLNTAQMVNAARHMIRVPVMFVLGDTDAPRTLYFCDQYTVEYWPERIGDDVPYDLDKWPKKIDDWTALVAEWGGQMTAFGTTLSGHTGNGDIHVTAEQKSAWTAKQNAINDLASIRAGAALGATAIQSHQDISGKADLVGGKVPSSQLPSYVDDVLEYEALANFPATGEEGKIYVAKDTNKTYRWGGSGYVQVGGDDAPVTSVNSKTGDVVLSATDVGAAPSSHTHAQSEVTGLAAALDAKLSRAEAEAGFTEWSFSGLPPGAVLVSFEYGSAEIPDDVDGYYAVVEYGGLSYSGSVAAAESATSVTVVCHDPDDWQIPITVEATRTRLPMMADIPTKTSDLTNDSGFLTQHQQLVPVYSQTPTFSEWTVAPSLSGSISITWVPDRGTWQIESDDIGDMVASSADGENATELLFGGYTATRTRTDIIGYTLGTQTPKLGKMDDVRFAPVYSASSAYAVGALCVKDGRLYRCKTLIASPGEAWNAAHWDLTDVETELARKYEKPSGGIPSTDLASGVQTSLGKADTAVQPAGIAAKMPMYPFEAGTFVGAHWTFSSESLVSNRHFEILFDSTENYWYLLDFPDSATFDPSEDISDYSSYINDDAQGTAADTSVTFSKANVTATLVASGPLTASPFKVMTYTLPSGASSTVAMGALPTGLTGVARDAVLVIDCTSLGQNDTAPTVTWPQNFHPRTDAETDFACEVGAMNVYYITEYATGEYAVGGWVETEGGSGT